MMLSPLVQAGALQNSQSPVDTEGGGDGASMEPLKFYRCSNLLICHARFRPRRGTPCLPFRPPTSEVKVPHDEGFSQPG
jgi:hypothetical protein